MIKFLVIFLLLISILSFVSTTNDRCRIFEFRCANAKCIPKPLQCNGKDDCGDNSDEICDNLNLFPCDDNRYIPKSKLCDGIQDCSNDEDLTECENHKCDKDHFLCRKIPMTCIDNNAVCNNVKDCADESDESQDSCEYLRNSKLVECNNATQFRCANKQLCISKFYHCDGYKDCTDHSDEQNCKGVEKKTSDTIPTKNEIVSTISKCSSDEFYCGAKSTTGCISNAWVCDSSYDCDITNRDEENCPNFKCPSNRPNKCKSRDICYENEKRCDGLQNCPDSSDEIDCPKQSENVTCNARTEFKCFKKNICVSFSKVCDNIDDCGDNSDERPGGSHENCLKKPCEERNGGCEQECFSMFYERKCYCKSGYEISSTNLTKCIDIDECAKGFPCSHICNNIQGSYECDCFPGFYKSTINSSLCEAVGEKYLLFSSKNSIRQLRLVHHHLEELTGVNDNHNELQAIGLDFDYKTGNIFWTQFEPYPAIVQFRFLSTNGKNLKRVLINERMHSPIGIAFDWIHGLLFWTDAFYHEISVLNVTNGHRRVLMKFNNDSKLQSIVVHPKFRRIYWTDCGNKPSIMSMGLDGKDVKTIVEHGLITPNGLALDYYLNELYWVDARARNIIAYNLKSGKRREVVAYLNAHGFSLDVFEDWLYLSDWHNQTILKIHKISGNMDVLISTPKPLGLKLMHQLAQPRHIENVCINSPCQYICLPSALNFKNGKQFQCQCPDNSELLSDNKTCTPIPTNFQSQQLPTSNKTLQSMILNSKTIQKRNIFLLVGFVFAIVGLVLISVIIVGIIIYRNYLHQVIKRATHFNNPIYYRKTSTHDLKILNPETIGDYSTYDIPAPELISNQVGESLLMTDNK